MKVLLLCVCLTLYVSAVDARQRAWRKRDKSPSVDSDISALLQLQLADGTDVVRADGIADFLKNTFSSSNTSNSSESGGNGTGNSTCASGNNTLGGNATASTKNCSAANVTAPLTAANLTYVPPANPDEAEQQAAAERKKLEDEVIALQAKRDSVLGSVYSTTNVSLHNSTSLQDQLDAITNATRAELDATQAQIAKDMLQLESLQLQYQSSPDPNGKDLKDATQLGQPTPDNPMPLDLCKNLTSKGCEVCISRTQAKVGFNRTTLYFEPCAFCFDPNQAVTGSCVPVSSPSFDKCLQDPSRFISFHYNMSAPTLSDGAQCNATRAAIVTANLPPVQVLAQLEQAQLRTP